MFQPASLKGDSPTPIDERIRKKYLIIYVLITVIVAQIIDNLYLNPFMVSGKVKMDPLLSIILILVGAQLFGILGMVLAIPIYLVYKIVLRESYSELIKIYPE